MILDSTSLSLGEEGGSRRRFREASGPGEGVPTRRSIGRMMRDSTGIKHPQLRKNRVAGAALVVALNSHKDCPDHASRGIEFLAGVSCPHRWLAWPPDTRVLKSADLPRGMLSDTQRDDWRCLARKIIWPM